VERGEFKSDVNENASRTVNHLVKNDFYAKGNMVNILETIPINNSITLDVVENVFIGVDSSQDEIHQYMMLFK